MSFELKKGSRVALIATITTILLALLKLIVGLISGSIVLLADSIHSFSDVIAIFASWLGLKIARKKPDEKFKYGYYKAENLATLIVAAFLGYAAYEIFMTSYEHILKLTAIKIPIIALCVSLFSSLISFFIAKYEIKVGKEINSKSLIANGEESRIDIISSLLVFFGILMSYLKIPIVEGAVGIILSLLILKIAFTNLKYTIYALMDASPDKNLEKAVIDLIKKHKPIREILELKLRQSGPFIFGEAKLSISKSLDINRGNQVAKLIQNEILNKFKDIESFAIILKPYQPDKFVLMIPVKNKKGLDSQVSEHFGRAKYYMIINIKNKKIVKYTTLKNPNLNKKIHAGFFSAKQLTKHKIDAIVIGEIGEIAFHTLRDNYIDIYKTKGKTIKDVFNSYLNNELKTIVEPTHEATSS